jgi:hypothetical protein
MDQRIILIVSFGVGVALQTMLLMRGDWDWMKLGGCLLIALCALLPDKHEHIYQPLSHVLMIFSIFALMFALLFVKDILQVLTAPLVLSYTLVFWFAFFTFFYDGTSRHQQLVLLLLVPSAASLIIAMWRGPLGFVTKLVLYSWFLIVIVSLGLMQFPFSQLAIFFEDQQLPWVTPLESFAAGMAFLFLLVNATYVFYLVPIPGKSESWAHRMKDWHEFTDELTQRVDNSQMARARIAAVLGVEAVALLLNANFHWLAPGLVINIALVLPAIVLRARMDPASAASPQSGNDGGNDG